MAVTQENTVADTGCAGNLVLQNSRCYYQLLKGKRNPYKREPEQDLRKTEFKVNNEP